MTIVFDFDGTLIENDVAGLTLERHIEKISFQGKLPYYTLKLLKQIFLISASSYKRLVLKCYGLPNASTLRADDLIWNKRTLAILRRYLAEETNHVIVSTASERGLVEQALLQQNIKLQVQGSIIKNSGNEYLVLNTGKEKISQLLKAGISQIDLLFTDHIISDYPLLKFSEKVLLISPSKKKMILNKIGSLILKNTSLL